MERIVVSVFRLPLKRHLYKNEIKDMDVFVKEKRAAFAALRDSAKGNSGRRYVAIILKE